MRSLCVVIMLLVAVTLAVPQQKKGGKKGAKKAPAEGAAMPMAPKPQPEMEKIIKMFAGTWRAETKFEPSPEMGMPQGGTAMGTDTARRGPGGHSLLSYFNSKSSVGAFQGHGVVWWNEKEQAYHSVWCDSEAPACDSTGVGHWEGSDLVFNDSTEANGKKIQMRQVYTDIKPESFTFYIDSSVDGSPMKRTLTIQYTKSTGAKSASTAAKDKS